MRSVLLSVLVLMPVVCEAQIFRNAPWNRSSIHAPRSGGCPGGICPTGTPTRAATVSRASAGHWSYPGTIDGHLQSTHGISTAGMSREQMLNTHDAIHEGRSIQQVAPMMQSQPVYRVTPQPVVQPPQPVYRAPITTLQPTRAPALPSDELFGLGAMLEPRSVELPKHVLGQIAEPAVESGFRSEIVKAIQKARQSGKINARQAVRLRTATLSPAFAAEAQALAVTQMAFSGEDSEHLPMSDEGVVQVEGINWAGLAKFLEALVPLLLTLLKAFGM